MARRRKRAAAGRPAPDGETGEDARGGLGLPGVLSILLLVAVGAAAGWVWTRAGEAPTPRAPAAAGRVDLDLPPPTPAAAGTPDGGHAAKETTEGVPPAAEEEKGGNGPAGETAGKTPGKTPGKDAGTAAAAVEGTSGGEAAESGGRKTVGEGGAQKAAPETPEEERSGEKTAGEPAPGGPFDRALAPAPAPGLEEEGPYGPLPVVAEDGRRPVEVYARPFDRNDPRPRVAIVVGNLGLSRAVTEAAIERLPGAVTLAFSPYARNLEQWVELARSRGHEVLIDLPMEPLTYPANDPGPHTLLTSLAPAENRDRLYWVLSRMRGYVGVRSRMGSRFTTSSPDLAPVLEELARRGLLFLDSRAARDSLGPELAAEAGLPFVASDRTIDETVTREAIDRSLRAVEDHARKRGAATALAAPYPISVNRIAAWAEEATARGVALAPVSALARAGGDR